jgi:[protein-PII] uridylyltransferase
VGYQNNNDVQDDPLFRRIRQHAEKRLLLSETQSDKDRLAHLKEFLRLENEMLHRYHQKGDSGIRVTRARSVLIDVLIQSLHAYALEITRDFLSKKKPVALIATGGYGRGELSPHSDIDLMFLYPKSASGKALESLNETMTREILYPLWDLGMKVGHATRAVKETLDESRRDIFVEIKK